MTEPTKARKELDEVWRRFFSGKSEPEPEPTHDVREARCDVVLVSDDRAHIKFYLEDGIRIMPVMFDKLPQPLQKDDELIYSSIIDQEGNLIETYVFDDTEPMTPEEIAAIEAEAEDLVGEGFTPKSPGE